MSAPGRPKRELLPLGGTARSASRYAASRSSPNSRKRVLSHAPRAFARLPSFVTNAHAALGKKC